MTASVASPLTGDLNPLSILHEMGTNSDLRQLLRRRSSSGLKWKSINNESGATHSYSQDEVFAFAKHANRVLKDDPDLQSRLPLDVDDCDEIFKAVADGVILCKLAQLVLPKGHVNARKLHLGLPLSIYHQTENCNLVIDACQKAGCNLVNVGAEDIIDGRPHIVLSLLWQNIRIYLLRPVSLAECPDLMHLMELPSTAPPSPEHGSAADAGRGAPFSTISRRPSGKFELPAEELLLRWINHHLEYAGHARRVANFGRDLADGVCLCALVCELLADKRADRCDCAKALGAASLEIDVGDREDWVRRAALAISAAEQLLHVEPFITAEQISGANRRLNLAFVAQLFNARPQVRPLRRLRVAALAVQRAHRRKVVARRNAAASVLQAGWTAVLARRAAAAAARQEHAAGVIQGVYREACERAARKKAAATQIQRVWRHRDFVRKERAVTAIQKCYRESCHRVAAKAAATRLQRAWRRHSMVRRENAAALIQHCYQHSKERHAQKEAAACLLQVRWRRHNVVRREKAAALILRCYQQSKDRHAQKEAAACLLQARWRRHNAARKKLAAAVIWRSYRGSCARAAKKQASATRLQRQWRRHHAARRARAAATIQHYYKESRSRFATKQAAAKLVQRRWRIHNAVRKEEAAVAISTFIHGACRRHKAKQAMAGRLQRQWRVYRSRQVAKTACAVACQRRVRGKSARKVAAVLRRRHERMKMLKAPLRAARSAGRWAAESSIYVLDTVCQAPASLVAAVEAAAAGMPSGRKTAKDLLLEEEAAAANGAAAAAVLPSAAECVVAGAITLWVTSEALSAYAVALAV